jgi:hypothetical protein
LNQNLPVVQQNQSLLIPDLITKVIASAGMILILLLFERFVKRLQTETDLEQVFSVIDQRGINFWRNYTLSRFVGVQDEKRLPRISQVEIVGGGCAVISLWITWLLAHFAWYIPIVIFLGAGIVAGLYLRLGELLRTKPLPWLKTVRVLGIWGIVIGGLAAVFLVSNNRWETFRLLADITFWTFFAYCVGIGAWVSMNATLYILQGLKRIPMKLSPYNQFDQIKPLLAIRSFSTTMMNILFITMIGIVSIILVFSQQAITSTLHIQVDEIHWLSFWMQFALSILFAAIAIGVRWRFIIIVAIFIGLEITLILSNNHHLSLPNTPVVFDISLLVLGGFLTFINVYQANESKAVLQALMVEAKEKSLQEIDAQISHLRNWMREILPVPVHNNFTDKTGLIEYTQSLQGLEALIGLRKIVEKVEDQPKMFVTSQTIPFILSALLPTVWDKTLDTLLSNLSGFIKIL